MKNSDYLVVGGGIFGLTAALELRQRGHSVTLINPDTIPHPLAASTDISKAVRMEYGRDLEYMAMADEAIDGWKAWNDLFGMTLYHEVGFLLTSPWSMEEHPDSWEWTSYVNLLKAGQRPERLDAVGMAGRFPAFSAQAAVDGFFNPRAGFVEAALVIETLAVYARQLEVEIKDGQTAETLLKSHGQVTGVRTREGQVFQAGHTVICAGPYTPYLVPELQPFMRITGHPVYHLRASRPELFSVPRFAVFTADITNTGWYGFPLHPREGVVKIANHGRGIEIHPENDPRVVSAEETALFRQFLAGTFPALADDPIVYTRRCLYTDTLDGHFWIDRHPELAGLTIGSGGSGHGLKMGPVLGRLIATAAEGGAEKWSAKFRWRTLTSGSVIEEEARHQ